MEEKEGGAQGRVPVPEGQASPKPESTGGEDNAAHPEKPPPPPPSEAVTSKSRTTMLGPLPQATPTPEVTRPPSERTPQAPSPPPQKATPTQQAAPVIPLAGILQAKSPPSHKTTPPKQETTPTSLDSTRRKRPPHPPKTPPTQQDAVQTPVVVTHPHIVPPAMTSSNMTSYPPPKPSAKLPDQTPTTSAIDLTSVASEAQMATSYQPVVQVTPHGAIVTLVPTNQLQMALQQQQEAPFSRSSAMAPTGVVDAGRKKRAPVVQPVHPQVQMMAVPRPETYESTQVCQIKPTKVPDAMVEAAASSAKTSQIEPTHAFQKEPTIPVSSAFAVQVASTHKVPNSVPGTGGSVVTQVTAPVAHVPVVRSTGKEEVEEGKEGREEEERGVLLHSGIGNAEKLMVQKPEILGAGEHLYICRASA